MAADPGADAGRYYPRFYISQIGFNRNFRIPHSGGYARCSCGSDRWHLSPEVVNPDVIDIICSVCLLATPLANTFVQCAELV